MADQRSSSLVPRPFQPPVFAKKKTWRREWPGNEAIAFEFYMQYIQEVNIW